MTDPTIYIAAKPPLAGVVKTRLARSIGDGPAVGLYLAFLQDLAAEVGGAGTEVGWFISPQPRWHPPSLGPRQVATRWQRGQTWSERQAELFADCHRAGYPATLLIASDSPQLTVADVRQAVDALREADMVVGPVRDGGYYLLGLRGGHQVVEGIEMSTARVCEQVTDRARDLDLRLRVLPTLFDVDEVEDLASLARAAARLPHLVQTRAALAGINLAAAARSGR